MTLKLYKNFSVALVFAIYQILQLSPFAYALPIEAQNHGIVSQTDGELSQELHIPLDEWYPKDSAPKALLLAIHGLTLHADCYQVIGKAFAQDGFYSCAPDLRGFGRCYSDITHKYCVGNDCKRKVDFEKSYADIVQVASALRSKYPHLPMYVLGESLGTSFCIRLAADHPELVDALILSAPSVKIHPLMFFHPATFAAGAWAVFIDPWFRVDTNAFVKHLVSNDPKVVDELLDDPLCRKTLTIRDLLKAQHFVAKTIYYSRKIKPDEAILVIQGSRDRCMESRAITTLAKNIPSTDQTLRWLHDYGHLLLETAYIRPATVDALDSWVIYRQLKEENQAHTTLKELINLGAKSSQPDDSSAGQAGP